MMIKEEIGGRGNGSSANYERGREKGVCDVIIYFNYLQNSFVSQIKDGLRRGGLVMYETFLVGQIDFGIPRNSDYLFGHM